MLITFNHHNITITKYLNKATSLKATGEIFLVAHGKIKTCNILTEIMDHMVVRLGKTVLFITRTNTGEQVVIIICHHGRTSTMSMFLLSSLMVTAENVMVQAR